MCKQIIFIKPVNVTISYQRSSSCTGETLVRPQAAPVKEPLTDSQLRVGSHDITRKQQHTNMLLNCRTSAPLDERRCYRSAAGSESGWRQPGVGWMVRGGPSAGCAGWDGAGWFPLLQLKSHTGKHLKPTVCSQTEQLKLKSSPLKHTSVLTWSVLRFGYRCDPFGLKIEDTDQCWSTLDSLCVYVIDCTSISKEDSTITRCLLSNTAFWMFYINMKGNLLSQGLYLYI